MNEPNPQAQACVIWMHGLGANATDMMGLSEQLLISEIDLRHVYIDAPQRPVTLNNGMIMPAWYDILGMALTDREDKKGIEQSAQLIHEVINEQLKAGFSEQQIYLAGFSQGGAMAIYTALHYKNRLGGVIALSAYLPLARETQPQLDCSTPFFMGSGQHDPLVLPLWTQETKTWLLAHGYEHVDSHLYPMEHSVCYEEIKDISVWLTQQILGGLQ
jgi:phospholipase/carboxylesterase